jgi:hypothetical protein
VCYIFSQMCCIHDYKYNKHDWKYSKPD